MGAVRVLVGTSKGAFILTSDGKREQWQIDGPHFGGWEIFHLKGSPVDPNRLYASQSSDWFGQVVHRSDDGGKSWETVGNEFAYEGDPGSHQWYDGTPHPWEFKRVWHFEPGLTDPDVIYAGVEDAALFRSADGGQTWSELSGLRGHGTGPSWQPGAGGLCLHIDCQRQHWDIFYCISQFRKSFRVDFVPPALQLESGGVTPGQAANYTNLTGTRRVKGLTTKHT